jgi:PHD/YefM family antitoxin component YafN of YafNO toxin-antitoxin module
MAEDDNKSNKVNKSNKNINGISSDYYENLEEKRTTELSKSTPRQQELQQRLEKTQEDLVERLMQVNGQSSSESQAQINVLSSRTSKLQEAISQADQYQISKVNEDIASGLERYTRPQGESRENPNG